MRCERQEFRDTEEELVREQDALERELKRQPQALSVTLDEQVRRAEKVDDTLDHGADEPDGVRTSSDELVEHAQGDCVADHRPADPRRVDQDTPAALFCALSCEAAGSQSRPEVGLSARPYLITGGHRERR